MAGGIAGLARALAPVLGSPDLPAAAGVRPALIIVLSGHQPGDTVRYSQIIPVQQALGISAGRAAEVLQEMGVLDDDRRPSFESWLDRKLDGPAPGIRADVEAWLRTMRDGGPRSRPRDIASARNHMNQLRLLALRSLFAFCTKHKTIFRSPVQSLRVGQHP